MSKVGIKVIISYCNNRTGAKETVRQIKENGCKCLLCRADVSSSSDVKKMFIEVEVDILVNKDGGALWSPFMEITEEL